MDEVFFSVVIPSFNRAPMLERTISSVIGQTYAGWELVIVDDASSDNTSEVVMSFNDCRIKYFKNPVNIERSASRNLGISMASGRYICFLDSDDIWTLNHLEVLYNYLSGNNFPESLLFTGFSWFFQNGVLQQVKLPSPEGLNPVEYIIEYQPSPSGVCVPASALARYRFIEELRVNEDVELFTRIVAEYPLVKLPEYTVTMNIHDNNTRSLVKDYITPQIEVFKLICTREITGNLVSEKFRKKRMRELKARLIKQLELSEDYKRLVKELICFLLRYPFAKGNKARFVSLLYNIPGGNVIKKSIYKIKSI